MDLYDRTSDPSHHLSNFKSRMYLADASDTTRCKAFPNTLTKVAMKWFDNLPPRSITSFDDLARKFLTRFSIQKDKTKHAPSLLGVKQEVGETLRDYMERFNKACLEIQNLPTKAMIMGIVNGLKEGPFSQSISKRYPTSLNKVQGKKFLTQETFSTDKPALLPSNKGKGAQKERRTEHRKYHNYTLLRVFLVNVYREICHMEMLPPPRLIKHKKAESQKEYCEYHKFYEHSANECYDLKNIIGKLAREG
ncbi:uncharacterized protein [Arachis hypogaea]|uniref:uncharacterized protein n=1 Tax=Arachis hypogaea TaxID=3818 RepID=UPI000DEC2BC3|nr:uncharacterized protein LOC112726225 [Arachis hypogaea]